MRSPARHSIAARIPNLDGDGWCDDRSTGRRGRLLQESELRRRANEVAILLRGAGVAVEMEDRWARAGVDAATLWLSVLMVLSFGFVTAVVLGAV